MLCLLKKNRSEQQTQLYRCQKDYVNDNNIQDALRTKNWRRKKNKSIQRTKKADNHWPNFEEETLGDWCFFLLWLYYFPL